MTTRITRLANGNAYRRVTLGTASRTASLYGVLWVTGAAALTAAHALTGGHYQNENVEVQSEKPSVIVPAPPQVVPPPAARFAPAAMRDPYPEFKDEQIVPATTWANAPGAAITSFVAREDSATPAAMLPDSTYRRDAMRARAAREQRNASHAVTKSRTASSAKFVAEKHPRTQPAQAADPRPAAAAAVDGTATLKPPGQRVRELACVGGLDRCRIGTDR